MDRRITLRNPSISRDSAGAAIETFSDFATIWAQFVPLENSETNDALALRTDGKAEFRTRYLAGVTPQMQLVSGGVTWRIIGVQELGRHVGLSILVERFV